MNPPTHLTERDFSAEQRKAMAKNGQALPDGSFPIPDVGALEDAIKLWGHAADPAAAKRHIIKRAKALGATDKLPAGWKVQEAESQDGHLANLREAVDLDVEATDAEGHHLIEATLIRSGTSKMGNHYPREVLEASVPLFEGARAFVDHNRNAQLPERSVRDLVGYYKNVRMDGDRLRGQLHLVPGHDWLFSLLKEAQGNPNLCGLSIDAWADQDPHTKHVRAISRVESVDVVTKPSAGGQLDRVLHSDTGATPTMDPQTPTADPPANTPPANDPTPPASHVTEGQNQPPGSPTSPPNQAPATNGHNGNGNGHSAKPEPDLASLLESLKSEKERMAAELARVQGILAPAPAADGRTDDVSRQMESVSRLVEEMKRDRDIANCRALLTAKLSEANLPEPVAKKVRARFDGQVFESSVLDAFLAEEKATLAELTSAGLITGQGYEKSHVSSGLSPFDQVQAAFDALFDIYESDVAKTVPKLSGIREAFRVATGVDIFSTGGADRPLTESLAEAIRYKVRSGQLRESEVLLKEADVTTASFSYLLGTSMNKRLLADYQAWPSEWQKFCTIVGIKDFKLQNRIRLGAFGSLSTVAEDAAYTTLSVADTQATYTPTKRGNLVQITRETIINDDLYAIKQIPQKLAVAAAFTLAEFVYGLLSPGGANIYDSHPLFDSVNHLNTGIASGNLGTANSGVALASAALQTAVIAMRKQKNLASKPIGLKPRYLLVPPDLEFTAMTILKSAGLPGGNNNDINPMMGYCEPIVAPQLNSITPASTTLWIAVADPRVIDTIEIGFVGGQANPVLLIQDMPLYGLNFTQDVISYKVRHEYGGAVVDYRGFYLGNN